MFFYQKKTMDFDLRNKVVWITGASSGIGEHLAYEASRHGAKLILSARNKEKLDSVCAQCKKNDANCIVIPLDLGNEKEIQLIGEKISNELGPVDYLINNGGVSQRSQILETSAEVERKIMEINFFGTTNLTKSVLPGMVKKGAGHIVVVSSITGKFGFPLRSVYAASKHALHGYFETLRAELSNKGIKVTMILPGRVKTNISFNAITKDGNHHGQMDPGQEKGISPEICAKKIWKAVKKNKKEILIGKKEVLMVYIRKFLPGIFYRIVNRIKPN